MALGKDEIEAYGYLSQKLNKEAMRHEIEPFLRGIEDYQKGKLRSQCPYWDWREDFWLMGWERTRYRFIKMTEEFRKKPRMLKARDVARAYASKKRELLKNEAERRVKNQIKAQFKISTRKRSTHGSYVLLDCQWHLQGPGLGSSEAKPKFDKLQVQTVSGRAAIGLMNKPRQDFAEWITGPPKYKEKK